MREKRKKKNIKKEKRKEGKEKYRCTQEEIIQGSRKPRLHVDSMDSKNVPVGHE